MQFEIRSTNSLKTSKSNGETKMDTTSSSEKTYKEFSYRHIGTSSSEEKQMLKSLSLKSMDELIKNTVPEKLLETTPLNLPNALSEKEALNKIKAYAQKNKVLRNFIGMGYFECDTPSVIQRNILENPGWYTQYTPYQAEISQGRLEALVNFQTMVIDLTGMEIANASLLDEGTAAAEAMSLAFHTQRKDKKTKFFVSKHTYPQTIEVLETRAKPLGIQIIQGNLSELNCNDVFAALVQYPDNKGHLNDFTEISKELHSNNALLIVASDLLALTLFKSPGEMGADIVVGNSQRFGVPLGFGGPHAAFFATKETFKRQIPGRIAGVSKDQKGNLSYRLALQTREQHIRREKATSNICTSQVLLAIMASMYAVYHGPKGLKKIAEDIFSKAHFLKDQLELNGFKIEKNTFFDTVVLKFQDSNEVNSWIQKFEKHGINLRKLSDTEISISLGEDIATAEIELILKIFTDKSISYLESINSLEKDSLKRESQYLDHPVFNSHHSETQMLRYIQSLQKKDLSLTQSMIPLGSCTMKLNATSEMLPVTWPEFSKIHPFAPKSQTEGYVEMMDELSNWLSEITGFHNVSLQPNAGSQGEYSGLLVIQKYHENQNQGHRNICLIPQSAHGTNPASAVMAGLKVVPVKCDDEGNIDIEDLKSKSSEHKDNLSSLMVTYPSTHGVFEESILEICNIIHEFGGQVYMDGANLNAQIGLCKPALMGADVCHLNLHKTFCIPHGGGGPGVGPIGVKKHLTPFLPGSKTWGLGDSQTSIGAISAAPWGSPSILPISWMYIQMMGAQGLKKATEIAILNANYMSKQLENSFPILYKGHEGFVAHECIIDLRQIQASTGITVEDVAKRLMDYGFHAPTMSWPVTGTLMIEPTESESKDEIDRFCEALIQIRKEIATVEKDESLKETNVLKRAPHTAVDLIENWQRPYSKEEAIFPLDWVKENKFWPPTNRIDNAYGDRNLMCSCPPMEDYES